MGSKRAYIFYESKNNLTVVLLDRETLDENMARLEHSIKVGELTSGDTPSHMLMGEEAYNAMGRPSKLFGIPVALEVPKKDKIVTIFDEPNEVKNG